MLAATQPHAAKKVNRPRGHSCCVYTRAQPSGPKTSRLGSMTNFRCRSPGPTPRNSANGIRKCASFTTKPWWTDHQSQGGNDYKNETMGAPMSAEEKAAAMAEMKGDNDAKMDNIAKNGTAFLGGVVVAGACALGGCETLIAGGAGAIAALVLWAGGNALIDWAAPPLEAREGPKPKTGGSGLPITPTVKHAGRKAAQDAAKAETPKGQPPIHHPAQKGQPPHFHPADRFGRPKPKHHDYPKR
jgi:hypothetical protein